MGFIVTYCPDWNRYLNTHHVLSGPNSISLHGPLLLDILISFRIWIIHYICCFRLLAKPLWVPGSVTLFIFITVSLYKKWHCRLQNPWMFLSVAVKNLSQWENMFFLGRVLYSPKDNGLRCSRCPPKFWIYAPSPRLLLFFLFFPTVLSVVIKLFPTSLTLITFGRNIRLNWCN